MNSVLVIGAGIGGLATAARLARAGHQVQVLEKGPRPGGRAGWIEKDGYRFDAGPTLFLMPQTFAETYTALGERMEDHLDLVRLDPTYRVHFHDGTSLDLTADLVHMRDQLDAIEWHDAGDRKPGGDCRGAGRPLHLQCARRPD